MTVSNIKTSRVIQSPGSDDFLVTTGGRGSICPVSGMGWYCSCMRR